MKFQSTEKKRLKEDSTRWKNVPRPKSKGIGKMVILPKAI